VKKITQEIDALLKGRFAREIKAQDIYESRESEGIRISI